MTSIVKHRLSLTSYILAILLLVIAGGTSVREAEAGENGLASKLLIDFDSPDAAKQVTPTKGVPASIITVDKTGISMGFPIQPAPHSGVYVTPATGTAWDLSAYGHIEAKVINTGEKMLPFVMQVEDGHGGLDNCEFVNVKPGETAVLKVIFGYQYGYEAGAPIKPSNIKQLYIFLWDTNDPHSFRIEELKAAGAPGEKPYIDPNTRSYKPANGVILGKGVAFDLSKQVDANGTQVAAGPDGALAVNFAGGKEESLKIKPAVGIWNLSDANQITVKCKNVGAVAVSPTVAVGPARASAKTPLAPGDATEITVSFLPTVLPVGDKEFIRNTHLRPGTGTSFESDSVKELGIFSDSTPGAKSLLITSVVADAAIDELPSWLGKRPPVDGDWNQTLAEDFNGPALDYQTWNIYGDNRIAGNYIWNRNHNPNHQAHFSKDNVILKDGQLTLRLEKKTGKNNDAETGQQTDYASGYLTTYGKWTQRYGYFEARLKLPKTLPGVWAAFALQPDRGKAAGAQATRVSTCKLPTDPGVGGMEFDAVDWLSRWGIYRFNIAQHANLYSKDHTDKFVGTMNNYVRADKDGYSTVGLLWTPGAAVVYNNGREIYRWENARVGDVQSYLMFAVVCGGVNNLLLDDSTLPADCRIKYVRVWQRKDLATPADGRKPNDGNPDETKN